MYVYVCTLFVQPIADMRYLRVDWPKKTFLTGLEDRLNICSSIRIQLRTSPSRSPSHTVHGTHHLHTYSMYVSFIFMHCQDAHVVSGVWWHPKLLHHGLHKVGMTTFTCQVYSTTTILQVWDTNYGTVDKETENWTIPHIVHYILVHFVFCQQFTDNHFMAKQTSQQEAVHASLKVGRQTDLYNLCAHAIHIRNTLKETFDMTDWIQHVQ